ncbi:NADH-quinone oxidoreductase subunit NuoF [Thermocrinis minervae]|uniref:NADH-quinone oxidoreductase subunit F n=1 Tax=Thermocrinis minervae TaxID=381751 RepID=A0A1M6T3T5_9AQUI|nr:NADH-quinone oxidoreductase subunit NuoF [Thermocrinis minervae]SHK51601.1 NADH-quinone oxidoreductase subunit F [Thermocrinis minervae]
MRSFPNILNIYAETALNMLLKRAKKPKTHTIEEYLADGGYKALEKALSMKPEEIIEHVEKSDLRGRGGAGFPTGKKWRFAVANPAPRYLVCNADESEPGTFKDRVLIERDPHLLIEGMIISAYAIGANEAFIYIRGEYPAGYYILRNAIEEAKRYGFLGKNILGSGFDLEIYVARGAGAYICGEESALIESLEGKRGFPRIKPPYPVQHGLWGRPTVVNNVETLCNIPFIVSMGWENYKYIGPSDYPGPKLFPISGKVKKPGVYELPMNTTLREVIFKYAGGTIGNKKVKAVFSGALDAFSADELDTPMDYSPFGFGGTGTVIVLTEDDDLMEACYKIAEFYAHESCGQCTPCRVGTHEQEHLLKKILKGEATEEDWEGFIFVNRHIQPTSICGLGAVAGRLIKQVMEKFPEEVEAYRKRVKA